MNKFTYEIVESFGTISEEGSYSTQLNLISYNNREPKYDLRKWDVENDKMSKGITLTKEELIALRDLLNTLEL